MFESLCPTRRVGRRHHYSLQDVQTCDYSAALALLITHKTQLQCDATRQDDVIPLTVRNVVERLDRTCFMPLKT
jgi:hypothetical protein